MPKDFFKLADTVSLNSIPEGSKIHFIGVCGVAMAQLAVELSQRGYQVSGSDKEFYDPMGSLLKESSVELFKGYKAENVPEDAALVVIGNAVSYGHPEVEVVEDKNLPYSLFTKLLYETLIAGNHSIVCAGTHGKSTSSALAAHTLFKAGYDPSFFVGGIVPEFGKSLHVGGGAISVVEGDEYDSAFFAKVPKFSFYKPNTLIITSVEFDHADIYDSYEAVEAEFTKLVNSLGESDRVLVCIESPQTKKLVLQWRQSSDAQIISYGLSEDSDIKISDRKIKDGMQLFKLSGLAAEPVDVEVSLLGEYNALNAASVLSAAYLQGCELEKLIPALASFNGLKRRQEVRFASDSCTLIEDFAHHPTAVKKTLEGMRELYPNSKIRVAFEPRSATSMRDIFQDDYAKSFDDVDEVLLCRVQTPKGNSEFNYMDTEKLAAAIKNSSAASYENSDTIAEQILSTLEKGDVLILMSNGSFGGLADKLESALRAEG